MPQGLSSYHWTDAMAEKATYLYFTSTITLMLHTCFLMPQGLSSYHWTDAMAKEATHVYFTSTFTLTPFDVTGSQLVPLDRRNGRRGDILLLHALPAALVQQALGRGPGLHPPSHDVG